jgi:hypothetical protein
MKEVLFDKASGVSPIVVLRKRQGSASPCPTELIQYSAVTVGSCLIRGRRAAYLMYAFLFIVVMESE